jgi:hypothetical protein
MRHFCCNAHIDQLFELRMHQNEVYAERFLRHLLRCNNFLLQQFRRHGGCSNHPERACVRQRRYEMPLAHPAHRPAHDGMLAAKQIPPALPEIIEGGRH